MDTQLPPIPTVCPTCCKRFGCRAVRTVAEWHHFGTPPDEAIVHVGCRFKPRKKKTERPSNGLPNDAEEHK